MTEQVIDIRDRIEKMRNQMTVPNSKGAVPERKVKIGKTEPSDSQVGKDIISKEKKNPANQPNNSYEKKLQSKSIIQGNNEQQINSLKSESKNKIDIDEVIENEKKQNSKPKESFKVYEDYHNDRLKDEKKQSVKFDEKQPFPQFSLNVSNPISWKLMLLIMLMQLLTNMMLVVVLYLK